MSFLSILAEPEKPFEWIYTDPDTKKRYPATVFTLVQLPDEAVKEIRARHTTVERTGHSRDELVDNRDFSDDVLDAAIKSWTGMYAARGETKQPLECTRAMKLALPTKVKAEILRVVLGKEAGLEQAVSSKS